MTELRLDRLDRLPPSPPGWLPSGARSRGAQLPETELCLHHIERPLVAVDVARELARLREEELLARVSVGDVPLVQRAPPIRLKMLSAMR